MLAYTTYMYVPKYKQSPFSDDILIFFFFQLSFQAGLAAILGAVDGVGMMAVGAGMCLDSVRMHWPVSRSHRRTSPCLSIDAIRAMSPMPVQKQIDTKKNMIDRFMD